MAKITIPAVKAKFRTGDRPTQEDYEDLIDTLAGAGMILAHLVIMKTQSLALKMLQ